MISQLAISVFLAVPNLLVSLVPPVMIAIPKDVLQGLSVILANVRYFIPVGKLFPILVASTALILFKIVWAVTIRVKSFVPTMGA